MRILREKCTGLLIDIQERLFPHMDGQDELLRNTLILIRGLQALHVPLLLTEQYPKGLGNTLNQIKEVLGDITPIEKIAFSCCDEPAFHRSLQKSGRKTVIIAGIEAHVCILQTVIDLIGQDHIPVVVSDCIASRKRKDLEVALARMEGEGAIITTTESILFELARLAGNDEFKLISRLVK